MTSTIRLQWKNKNAFQAFYSACQIFIHTNEEVWYSQIEEEVIALVSEALVHDEGEDNQRVSDHHHDHQGYHKDGKDNHRVPGERGHIRGDGRDVGAGRIESWKAGDHCQSKRIWETSNRFELIVGSSPRDNDDR